MAPELAFIVLLFSGLISSLLQKYCEGIGVEGGRGPYKICLQVTAIQDDYPFIRRLGLWT